MHTSVVRMLTASASVCGIQQQDWGGAMRVVSCVLSHLQAAAGLTCHMLVLGAADVAASVTVRWR